MKNNIKKSINNALASQEETVVKLRKLNDDQVLNCCLAAKQHDDITQAVIKIMEDRTQTADNIDVLRFYLHELSLIFNLNIDEEYFNGVV